METKIEVTENYIRIPNPKHTQSGCKNLRTIEVSPKQGIKGLYCIDHKSIKTFLFDKSKFSLEEAKRWVQERSKSMEKKYLQGNLEEVAGEKLFVASTSMEDRQGEILDVEGWDLKNFKKNPVMLWAHNNDEPPIATAKSIGVRMIDGVKKLVFEPIFHDVTERAREIAKLVELGIVKTVSVGFLPIERDGNIYKKQELLEISFVPVPANPEALSLALSKGISEEVVKEIFEKEDDDLKKDLVEIKKSLAELGQLVSALATQKEESATNKKHEATADQQVLRRNAQIVQKATEMLLKELKQGKEVK